MELAWQLCESEQKKYIQKGTTFLFSEASSNNQGAFESRMHKSTHFFKYVSSYDRITYLDFSSVTETHILKYLIIFVHNSFMLTWNVQRVICNCIQISFIVTQCLHLFCAIIRKALHGSPLWIGVGKLNSEMIFISFLLTLFIWTRLENKVFHCSSV